MTTGKNVCYNVSILFVKEDSKMLKRKSKEMYLLLFIVSFFGMMISFIPSMFENKGIFLYYGDFNSQQMMFYQHAHDMVRNGNMNWDWGTDLGTSFVSSYSFYLLGSPFFWITTLFPSGAVPYLIPWLLALKTAVASVTAYAYIRFFSDNQKACFIGGMLYAFSGFQTYNVFFNHFHDATAVFPLLLLSFELLVRDNKKGVFALSCALCACVSYFFFISECVFLVIYFFLRCCDDEFKITMPKFFRLIIEAVIGVFIAGIIFIPSIICVLGNYRIKERLYGLDMMFYADNLRIPRIIQAFFMLSDMPARINILDSDKARWASLAAYLPLFSMTGVIAFMRTRKKNWLSKSVIVFTIMAFIPILNSAFVMFNSSYYTRWFYMPILLMCVMTAKVIDENHDDLKKGFIPTAVVGILFLLVGALPKNENGIITYFKVPSYIELYYIQAIVTVLMILIAGVLIYVYGKQKKNQFMRTACFVTAFSCIVCMSSSVIYGSKQGADNKDYIDRAINGKDNINMEVFESKSSNTNPDNNFYRIDTSPNVDNWCMFWGMSSMRCFHSVVSTSIMDFYSDIGQTRDVASRMETSLYPLRSLFSVKYYFNELTTSQKMNVESIKMPETIEGLVGFKYVGIQNGFAVYENQNYIPMGFAYDTYVTQDMMTAATSVEKTSLLLHGVVLSNEQIVKFGSFMNKYQPEYADSDEIDYNLACSSKRAKSCKKFEYSTNGFNAEIDLDKPELVFFSVPFDEGWSAEVNGQKVDIEKVSYGFMAVPCGSGNNQIKFTYKTYGSTLGLISTVSGSVIWIVYFAVDRIKIKKKGMVDDASE